MGVAEALVGPVQKGTCYAIVARPMKISARFDDPNLVSRADLIDVAARTARHGRGHLTLHLPEGWHREHEWLNLLDTACGPPAAAA